MVLEEAYTYLLRKIGENLEEIDTEQTDQLLRLLSEAYEQKRILGVVGAGRSGLVAKSLAMRLMHLDFSVFVIGETITPALKEGDILLAVSGSGETAFTVSAAQVARQVKARVIAITSFRDSRLAKLSDVIVTIPGRTSKAQSDDYFSRQLLGIHEPLAPLGTLFELTVGIFFDSLVIELMRKLGVGEAFMKNRHATIE